MAWILIFFIIFCVDVFSEPKINEISSLTINDGMVNYIIKGTDFGYNNVSEIECLIDNIESGAPGSAFAKESWNNYYNNKAVYSTNDKHSGSKSILFDFYNDVYARSLVYDFGEKEVKEAYFTAWVKLVKKDNAPTFQWKNWKIKDTPNYGFQTCIYGENWYYSSSPGWGNTSVMVMRNTITDQSSKRTIVKDGFLLGEWQRLEAYYKKSDIGVNNGVFEWRRVGRYGGEVIASNYSIVTHDETNKNQIWRYLFIGHYYGNLMNSDGSPYSGIRDMDIYYDDIYISRSRARVEIGDKKIFSECTHREVQIIEKWPPVINESKIMITINKGSFVNGPVYLFVIDSKGNPSEGFPVTFN